MIIYSGNIFGLYLYIYTYIFFLKDKQYTFIHAFNIGILSISKTIRNIQRHAPWSPYCPPTTIRAGAAPGCFRGFVGDEILPNYIGIIS